MPQLDGPGHGSLGDHPGDQEGLGDPPDREGGFPRASPPPLDAAPSGPVLRVLAIEAAPVAGLEPPPSSPKPVAALSPPLVLVLVLRREGSSAVVSECVPGASGELRGPDSQLVPGCRSHGEVGVGGGGG